MFAVLGLYGLHSGDELGDLALQLLQFGAVLVVLLLLCFQHCRKLQLGFLKVQARSPRVVVTSCEGTTSTHLVAWDRSEKEFIQRPVSSLQLNVCANSEQENYLLHIFIAYKKCLFVSLPRLKQDSHYTG